MVAADSNKAASLLLNTSCNVSIHLLKLPVNVSSEASVTAVLVIREVASLVVLAVLGVPDRPIEAIGRPDDEVVVMVVEVIEAFCCILSRGSTIAA